MATTDIQFGQGTISIGSPNTGPVRPVEEQQQFGGEDIANDVQKTETRGSAAAISAIATTLIKTGPGNIHNIRCAGGTLGNVTIYDNTDASGTVLLPTITPTQGQVLLEDVKFSTGLTIVTAAATVITISYR